MILRYLNFLEKILYLENKINCGGFFRSSIVVFMWFFFLFCFNYVCLFALNDDFLLYTKVPHTALNKSLVLLLDGEGGVDRLFLYSSRWHLKLFTCE